MKDLAWVFGSSSKFSQKIINEFENNNVTVNGFGRDTLDYNDFDRFLGCKD